MVIVANGQNYDNRKGEMTQSQEKNITTKIVEMTNNWHIMSIILSCNTHRYISTASLPYAVPPSVLLQLRKTKRVKMILVNLLLPTIKILSVVYKCVTSSCVSSLPRSPKHQHLLVYLQVHYAIQYLVLLLPMFCIISPISLKPYVCIMCLGFCIGYLNVTRVILTLCGWVFCCFFSPYSQFGVRQED